MKKIHHVLKMSFLLIIILTVLVQAQTQAQTQTTYKVQSGDTLNRIARSAGLTLGQIVALNNIANPDSIYVGQVLNISLAGASFTEGRLLNPLDTTNTDIANEAMAAMAAATSQTTSQTTSEAVAEEPAQLVYFTDAVWPETYPAPITAMSFLPAEAWQGQSFGLNIELEDAAFLKAIFLGQEYPFYAEDIKTQAAVLAVPVLQEPGVYPLDIEIRSMDGAITNLTLPMPLGPVDYGKENINLPPSSTSGLAPDTSRLEAARVIAICGQFDPVQRWTTSFGFPTEVQEITSNFGINRSYNGGPYKSYHRGLDLRARTGTPIHASENGIVRLAERLDIRGNAVLLDHGLGMCTAYSHLSEILVSEGEEVSKGQVIGHAGATGMVTAAHLHWELRVMGIPVNPLQWAR